jgi:branched-chain amino acid aminotransferase
VKNNKILTPPLNSGCLEGITRGILLEIAPEAGVSVVEQAIRPEDLYTADEVFLSSTNRNVISVGEIAGNKITFAPGPVTQQLTQIFDSYLTDYVTRRMASAAR